MDIIFLSCSKLLGIKENASKDDIKKAYYEKMMKNHPDKNNHPYAAELSKAYNQAYEAMYAHNIDKKIPIDCNEIRYNHEPTKTPIQELGKEIMKYLYAMEKPNNLEEAKKIAKHHLKEYDTTQGAETYSVLVDAAFKTRGW